MSEPVRVALVEDNEAREALEMLLGPGSDIEIVASVEDGTRMVELCREHSPDVVVMDYRLPALDGVQATRCSSRRAPRSPSCA